MPRYIVTGAGGFIGSHLCEALVAAGHEVTGLDCFTPVYDRARKEANLTAVRSSSAFEFQEVDLASDPLDAHLQDADGVFHLAGQPGVRASWSSDFDHYLRDNVLATKRLLDVALEFGTRIVFASSSSVYGDGAQHPTPETSATSPVSPYGVTKLACEHLAGAYAKQGLDHVVLRYFTVYGPRQRPDMAFARVAEALLGQGRFEIYGDGQQTRDFTYVADAVAASIAAMMNAAPGSVFNVGGGHAATLRDAIALFEQAAGRSLELVTREPAAGDARHTSSDTTRLRDQLAWAPRFVLEEGIRAQFEHEAAREVAGLS